MKSFEKLRRRLALTCSSVLSLCGNRHSYIKVPSLRCPDLDNMGNSDMASSTSTESSQLSTVVVPVLIDLRVFSAQRPSSNALIGL